MVICISQCKHTRSEEKIGYDQVVGKTGEMDDNRLSKRTIIIYKWDGNNKVSINWSRDCKRLIKDIGMENVWNQDITDVNVKVLIEYAEEALINKVKCSGLNLSK